MSIREEEEGGLGGDAPEKLGMLRPEETRGLGPQSGPGEGFGYCALMKAGW